MRKLRWIFFLCLFASRLALAHGGEDHSEKAAAPLSAEAGAVASATGSVFEVVLKASYTTPGQPSTVRVLLSDFASNAPIKEASIEVALKSASARLFSGKASPTRAEGVYEFSATFPEEGTYSADLTIQAQGRADLLAVSGLVIKAPETTSATASTFTTPGLIAGGVVAFLLVLGLGFLLGRGSRRGPQQAAPLEGA